MLLFALLVGCAPVVVDNSADQYDVQRPGPDALIDGDGDYVGGWWSDWTGSINLEDSSAPADAVKGWMHLSFNADDHFIVTNLADMGKAANVALLVVDKSTGAFHDSSVRYAFGDKVLEVNEDWDDFNNPPDGSWSRVNADGDVEFEVNGGGLSFVGLARPTGEPFIQTTRSVPGYGWLQFYQNLEIVDATLDLGQGPIDIAPGTLGALDRTLGHRSTVQTWNWLSTIGLATSESTGEERLVSIQVARDQEGADPVIDAVKYPVWVGDELFKLPDVTFDYDVLDEEARTTSGWTITSPEGGYDALDVSFEPLYHRRDQQDFLWFIHTDFNQYYGMANGTLLHDGETWRLTDLFALCEDSLLVL